jgi:hypothetical protein
MVQAVGVAVPSVNCPALLLLPAVAAGGDVPQELIVGRDAATTTRVVALRDVAATLPELSEVKEDTVYGAAPAPPPKTT